MHRLAMPNAAFQAALYIQSSTRGIISDSILGNKPLFAARLIAPYLKELRGFSHEHRSIRPNQTQRRKPKLPAKHASY
nr:MAG TPA: hypothetical protein [Inoviridae sp.]